MTSLCRVALGTAALVAAALAGSPALAADVPRELTRLEPRVGEVALRAEALHEQLGRQLGVLSDAEALQRFQDLLYHYMIGENEVAAEGFFALVEVGALVDEGLHRDAEWYLADSLFQMGNLETAEGRYQVVADDRTHPFRDDAVRRLLEIYALRGQDERFDSLYRTEILSGRVSPSDLITYSVGRNFYTQRELLPAKDKFRELQPGSPYYGKARYFLGTVAVVEGALQEAVEHFQAVAELSIDGQDARRVHDLALLALGRIHYELADYEEAAEYYSRISRDSEYAADQLYELVWTFIRTDAWMDALRGIDLFLIQFPEHAFAARLKVIKGKLHMATTEFDDARLTFEDVVVNYTPVRDRFSELASAGSTANREYFDEVLAISRSELGVRRLPEFAVAMILADPDLSRAISVFQALEEQEEALRTSEAIIQELRAALAGSPSLAGADRVRHEAMYTGRSAVELQLELLEAEERWHRDQPGHGRGVVDELTQRRERLTERASALARRAQTARARLDEHHMQLRRLRQEAVDLREQALISGKQMALMKRSLAAEDVAPEERDSALSDLASLQDQVSKALMEAEAVELRIEQLQTSPGAAADPALLAEEEQLHEDVQALVGEFARNRPTSDPDGVGKRIDAQHLALTRAHERLQGLYGALDDQERTQLEQVQGAFERVTEDVATYREELARLLVDAELVSAELTRDGFGRLEDFFARSVLDADIGIVDVYWAEKVEIDDEIIRVKDERQRFIGELDRRFNLIRQKIGY